jgi:hypothetical protein
MASRIGTLRIKALIEAVVQDILVSSNIIPVGNGGADLGSSDNRFANIYTQDLQLKNDRGDWTIIEEEDYLSIKNNKDGKLYKFVLEEVQGEEQNGD